METDHRPNHREIHDTNRLRGQQGEWIGEHHCVAASQWRRERASTPFPGPSPKASLSLPLRASPGLGGSTNCGEAGVLDSFFFAGDPLNSFVIFGGAHLASLAVLAALGYMTLRLGQTGSEKTRRRIKRGMIAVLLVTFVEGHFWHVFHGEWAVAERLPLHMCGAMVWVSIYGLWTDRPWTRPLMYYLGIAGAIQGVLQPDSPYGFPHVRFVATMISHSTTVVAGFWVISVEEYTPSLRSTLWTLALVHAYAAVIFVFNLFVGTNYLYIVEKPESASLMDVFPEWPWYLLVLEGLLLVIVIGMYLPFARLRKA